MVNEVPEDVRRLITQGNANYNTWAERMNAQPAGTVTIRNQSILPQGYSSRCELYSWKDQDTGRTMWNTNNPRYNPPINYIPEQTPWRQRVQQRENILSRINTGRIYERRIPEWQEFDERQSNYYNRKQKINRGKKPKTTSRRKK